VSDTFGKSSQKIIDKLLENPLDTSFDIGSLIHGSMLKKLPELELAVDGYITPEQAGKLKIIKGHFEDLESRKAELEKLILALAAPYQQELDIILTAPSFKNIFSAITVISEIGVTMEAFP
ncbi:IS110 family transposase, partial [Thermoanaerobacterium saccharolyticum]